MQLLWKKLTENVKALSIELKHFILLKVLHTFSFQFYKNKLVFILSNVNDKWYTYACTCFQLNFVREILDK